MLMYFNMATHPDFQDSLQLHALWRQMQESKTGLEMQPHRVRLRFHQNCIVGSDLVDWLIHNDKAVKRCFLTAVNHNNLIMCSMS